MSGNAARIGDRISCDDRIARGSSNVFINGMPASHRGLRDTTGHSCWPRTVLVGPWANTVFINGQAATLRGKTKIESHCCRRSCHDGVVSTASPNVHIEQ